MKDNQMNGHKNNKEAYCPNMFFDNGTVSIGEFITLDDAIFLFFYYCTQYQYQSHLHTNDANAYKCITCIICLIGRHLWPVPAYRRG